MSKTRLRTWAAGGAIALLTAALLPLGGGPASAVDSPGADVDAASDALVLSDAARVDPTVTLPVQTVTSPGRGGLNGVTTVRVGNSKPMRVIIDTGFSGLLLFPGAWERVPGAVKMTKRAASGHTPDGSRISGLVGSAPMTFGGVTTTTSIPFIYAKGSNAYARQWAKLGVFGLMGVGAKGGGTMINPFTALPGNLGLRWSIHFDRPVAGKGGKGGSVVLGAAQPTSSAMTFELESNGQNSIGALLWNDQAAPGCWTIGHTREVCASTWFDAAFNIMRVKGTAFQRVPHNKQGWIRKGTRVLLSESNAAFTGDAFLAGDTPSRNKAKYTGSGPAIVNTGNSYFFDYTLTYDNVTGRLSLSDADHKAGAQQ